MILLVHGGAGAGRPEDSPWSEGMFRALGCSGGTALASVLGAVSCLEEDVLWNAGRGAVLASDGLPRLDASLALSSGEGGGVGNLLHVASPIRAAYWVLQSEYSLLVGSEAEDWLHERGMPRTSPASRTTLEQQEKLLRWQAGEDLDSLCTVGAVALDNKGHLAAGTSTGGLRGKHPSRIGDSAVLGAGTWASSVCAISMTGDGDAILRRSSAARIAFDIGKGKKPRRAIRKELRALLEEGAAAGCIVLLGNGRSYIEKNCQTLHAGRNDNRGIWIPG